MSEALTLNSLEPEIVVSDDLALRLLEPDDSEDIFRILQEAPEIQSYITWTAGKESVEDIRSAIEEFQQGHSGYRYALLEGQEVIGYVGIFPYEENEYGLGYFCSADKRGKGYVTRAATKLMTDAKEKLPIDLFILYIADENDASKAVAARLNFSPTDVIVEDKLLDCFERRYERVA